MEQDALFYEKRRIGQGEGRDSEGENRDKGVSPEGSASKPRPPTLENQAQEGLNRLWNICFPPAPLKGLVAPKEFKGVISESFRRILSKVSGNHSNKAM